MKTVNVRYLKSGSINIKVPKELNSEETIKMVDSKFNWTSDKVLLDGLIDYDNKSDSFYGDDEFFDETLDVECILDVANDYKELFSTITWNMYLDPEYASNILQENKNMAHYLSSLSFTAEEINNICYGKYRTEESLKGLIEVEFISLWDGDTEITTNAKLNVNTGAIVDIEEKDVNHLKLNILSLESVKVNDLKFDAIEDHCDMDYAIDAGSLNQIQKLIETDSVKWANEATFHKAIVNNREFSFQLQTGACDEPLQPFNGDVLIDDGEAQFTINTIWTEDKLESIKQDVIKEIKQKYFSKSLNIIKFSGVSIKSDDLLAETKKLLLDQHADWTPVDIGGLLFKKETLEQFLEDDFFDNEDKPSQETLNEITTIIYELNGSSILYLHQK